MKIENLLSYMDQRQITTSFLSNTVLETLNQYDENLLFPSNIRKLVFEKISHAEMLRNKIMRDALIQSIPDEEDINILANMLEIGENEDNRKKLLGINITKNSKKEKKIFEFFEVIYTPTENVITLPDQNNITPQRPLFPHQRVAVDEIQNYLDGDEHAVLLHMPTGSGKTRTAMRIISNIFMKDKPTLIIWVALTEELCEQAVKEFQETWEVIGDRGITVFRLFGKHSPKILTEIDKDCEGFIVASISKLDHVQDDQFLTTLADRIQLVVMDEAHHVIAPTYKRTIEILAKKHRETKLLGLSATPGRTLEESEGDFHLADFFENNKVMLKIENENPVKFLIRNGYIADPDIEILEYRDKLTKEDKDKISENIDMPSSILEKLGTDVIRNMLVVSMVEKLVNDDQKRIIVFTPSIKSSRDIAMILSARGFVSYYVDSNISDNLRKHVIHEYRKDTDKEIILCNVNILTAGFDVPKTSAVVIARPTKSLVLYNQMIGRAIRGIEVGGNKKCYIRVITDKSIMAFKDIVSAFEHWEDAWK